MNLEKKTKFKLLSWSNIFPYLVLIIVIVLFKTPVGLHLNAFFYDDKYCNHYIDLVSIENETEKLCFLKCLDYSCDMDWNSTYYNKNIKSCYCGTEPIKIFDLSNFFTKEELESGIWAPNYNKPLSEYEVLDGLETFNFTE